ncbi:S24/S26 family peptidase [Neiella marina]|uniref:S24/S26 family peptidase n=1 Tax=Neiella holothuriorum TaxID=2870530 RepID=A0ABS7EFQ5_9GAMM|nr:S24/S26 family peptidase [Neiella holothuriorum]MBW8190616.1 S24/S26 family peptidase [Neiella holothuriorum]
MLGFTINKVDGNSMTPSLTDGSYVLFAKPWFKHFVRPGQVVKVRHPKFGLIIKAVQYVDRYGFVWLKGTGAESISTLEIGPVSFADIIGKALFHVSPEPAMH